MIQATAMSVSPRNYIIFHPKGQQSNKPVETVRRISWSWTHGIKQLACPTRDDKAIPCSLSRSCSYHNETQLCCMFFLAALCGLWKKRYVLHLGLPWMNNNRDPFVMSGISLSALCGASIREACGLSKCALKERKEKRIRFEWNLIKFCNQIWACS